MRGYFDRKTIVIINPAAGAGRAAARWQHLADTLRHNLGEFAQVLTSYPGHAHLLARDAIEQGYDLIVAAGGDGTASEVASALFQEMENKAPHILLAILPLGTGCDLMRTLAPGRSLDELLAALRMSPGRSIDVGHVSFSDNQGCPDCRIFLNVASFGCSGAVARSISERDKWFGPNVGFKVATTRTLLRYRDKTICIRLDDETPQTFSATNVAVCNARHFGGGMLVAPNAEIDDANFDITVWAGFLLKDFLLRHGMLYDGTHLLDERTTTARSKSVAASSEEQVFLEVDGEYVGQLPATFRIIPNAVRVILPGDSYV